jgi:hypothetical protein
LTGQAEVLGCLKAHLHASIDNEENIQLPLLLISKVVHVRCELLTWGASA